jgi:catechol 2,3-dioxygenase-like lactoylglutathione lyase family enzyme
LIATLFLVRLNGVLSPTDVMMLSSSKLQAIIWTCRMNEASHVYSDVLGLRFKSSSHGALVYGVGGGDLRVSPVPTTEPSPHTVLEFAVTKFTVIASMLEARGVHFERFPGLPHDVSGIVVTLNGAKVAWFRDPDGNLLSLVQHS